MSTRPSLLQLYNRIRQDIDSRLGTRKRPGISLVDILSKVIAGMSHSLHGHIEFLARNLLPDSARGLVLERWSAIFGIFRKSATNAAGNVVFKGEPGSVIPSGSILQGALIQYITRSQAVIDSNGEILVAVESVEKSAQANIDAVQFLTLVNPIPGVDSSVEVATGGISGGADKEKDVSLRARLLDRIRIPPKGGAVTDYKQWSTEVPGVTRAFVYPLRRGAGTVDVAFVQDDLDNIIPDADSEIVRRVKDHLEENAPVTARVFIANLNAKKIIPRIKIFPDTVQVRASVEAEIKDLLRRESAAGGAYKSDGTIRLSRLSEAISSADGEEYHDLEFPTQDVAVSDLEIATFGGIQWVA